MKSIISSTSEHQMQEEWKQQLALFKKLCQKENLMTNGNIILNEYLTIYLANAEHFLSPLVFEKYTNVIKKCISPLLGEMRIKDIKPIHIQSFVNLLQKRQSYFDGKPGKLSNSTVRRYYTILQSIIHSAYKMGIIDENPADRKRITLPEIAEQETEIFSPEEVVILFDYLENEPLKFKLLIHLAINTGCRRGELVALKWSDLDFQKETITVCRSNYKLKGREIESKSTKNNRIRRLSLPSYCISLLKQYEAEQMELYRQSGDKIHEEGWIFTQANGKPMYPTTPTLQFSRFLKKYNLPHKKFHALRHTSATLLLINGTNIKNVASRLGHSQIKTTNRYVHAIEAADRQAANTFEAMFHAYSNS